MADLLDDLGDSLRRLTFSERKALRSLVSDRRRELLPDLVEIEDREFELDNAIRRMVEKATGETQTRRPYRSREHRPSMSEREREVAQMRESGLSAREIAGALGISEHTVYGHLRLARKRVGAKIEGGRDG